MNFFFAAPTMLYGLLALAIPIIIHLFSFRRFRKIYFSDTRFLREVKEQTRSKTRLKNLLILAARLLTVLFIILAFAQPYIAGNQQNDSKAQQAIGVFVDNSFSMDAAGKNGLLLDQAKSKAKEIIDAYGTNDRFQLLSNDFEGRHQRFYSKEQFLQLLSELKISSATRSMSEVIHRQLSAGATLGNVYLKSYIISDFQQSFCDFDKVRQTDSSFSCSLLPLKSGTTNNLFVDTCYFTEPLVRVNTPTLINVVITNASNQDATAVPVKLFINKEQKAVAVADVPANGSVNLQLSFTQNTPGWKATEISIADYPISFDNNYYLSFNIPTSLKVLHIEGNKAPRYVEALFNNDVYFTYQKYTENTIDYAQLSSQNIVIVNEVANISTGLATELEKYYKQGGNILFIPAAEADLDSYNTFLRSISAPCYGPKQTADVKVAEYDGENILFKGVFEKKSNENAHDLPQTHQHYSFLNNGRGIQATIKLSSGDNILSVSTYKQSGKIYQLGLSFNAAWSNFAEHALFVPTLYQMALQSGQGYESPIYLGRNEEFTINAVANTDESNIRIVANDQEFVPQVQSFGNKLLLKTHGQISNAGNYEVKLKDNVLKLLSFNYNRDESELKYLDKNGLKTAISNAENKNIKVIDTPDQSLTKNIQQANAGTHLWKLCIILALLFMAAEIAFIKFLK